jgi:hypothetical protein
MSKSKEAGKQFISTMGSLFSALPEDKRKVIDEALADEKLQELLGESVLMKSDYTKQSQTVAAELDKVKLWKKSLDDWHAENQGNLLKVAEYEAQVRELQAKIEAGEGGTVTKIDTSNLVDKNTFQQTIAQVTNQGLGLMTLIPTLTIKHFQRYGEALDAEALVAHSRKVNLPIDKGGYQSFVAEKEAILVKQEQDKLIKEAEDRGYKKAMDKAGSSIPYPTGDEDSPLMIGLGITKDKSSEYSAAAAVRELNALVAKNNGLA